MRYNRLQSINTDINRDGSAGYYHFGTYQIAAGFGDIDISAIRSQRLTSNHLNLEPIACDHGIKDQGGFPGERLFDQAVPITDIKGVPSDQLLKIPFLVFEVLLCYQHPILPVDRI
jgi:hypothetical protein